MAKRTVWAVELFDSHWRTLIGGLTKSKALSEAKKLAKRETHAISIAEYTQAEGSSAISRLAV